MNNNLNIDTGVVRLTINDDPKRVIKFNPSDVVFAEKFYRLIKEFELKQVSYQARADEIDAVKEVDDHGIPVNIEDSFEFLKDVCGYMREKIDSVFGEGTSQTAFEDAVNLEMFEQFFDGITPFIEKARTQKTQVYTNTEVKRVMK